VYRGGSNLQQAKLRLQSIASSYKQFSSTYLNGFEQGKQIEMPLALDIYRRRDFSGKSYVMNIEEVATLYHLPHTNVETPYILWATAQTAEPPANLPLVGDNFNPDISPVAVTNFRGHNAAFGLPRGDRGRHMYIVGQTGVGKSGLLELLTISDMYSPFGFAVIDPHGDYAQNTLKRIPPERMKDVVYFNAADTEFPIAFNPLEVYDEKLKTHTCSELIGVLKRLFESWGPRLEYILRYSILALLDYPNATMLDITRILTDKKFRNEVLKYVHDPVVRNFWTVEFASWNDKFATEAVAPVLNKVGAFTANPLVRNIIGQPKSSFNIRRIMDERKILVVNLSRGLVGEDNAALLGALIVTKVQMAAMSRADIQVDQRAPFYLYVDEFQNFATDSFATILSEARKYGLCLTVANQYTAQMMQEVKDAVFGNVGSIIAFRMSADDARGMQRYFEPKFTEYDLIHMHNRYFIISMTVHGEKSPAFSGVTLDIPPLTHDATEFIVENSRSVYGTPLSQVEATIRDQYGFQPLNPTAPLGGMVSAPARPPKQKNAPKPKSAPKPQHAAPAPEPSPAPEPAPAPAPKPPAEPNPAPAPEPAAAEPPAPKQHHTLISQVVAPPDLNETQPAVQPAPEPPHVPEPILPMREQELPPAVQEDPDEMFGDLIYSRELESTPEIQALKPLPIDHKPAPQTAPAPRHVPKPAPKPAAKPAPVADPAAPVAGQPASDEAAPPKRKRRRRRKPAKKPDEQ
jgi:hypothetical protein